MVQVLINLLLALSIGIAEAKTVKDYTNRCMNPADYKYYRAKPGPEPTIECTQYRGKSCCKPGATQSFVSGETWQHIFNFNHCPQKKARLSPECHQRTWEQMCFYACDPNLGPWITKSHNNKNALERHVDLPICQSSCNTWWAACKKEYTCTDNWFQNLYIVNGESPTCSEDMPCKTYEEYFKNNSTYFCENIFDHSFKVYPDDHLCMQFVFDASKGSPNEAVELKKAQSLVEW